MSDRSLPDGHEDRSGVLAGLFNDTISAQTAAERLASLTADDDSFEGGLNVTWGTIIVIARKASYDDLEKLATMLADMASLPAMVSENGQQLWLHGLRVWSEYSDRYALRQ